MGGVRPREGRLGAIEDPQALLLGDPRSRGDGSPPKDLRIGLDAGRGLGAARGARPGPWRSGSGMRRPARRSATIPPARRGPFAPPATQYRIARRDGSTVGGKAGAARHAISIVHVAHGARVRVPERRAHVQPRLDRVRPVLVRRRLRDAVGPRRDRAEGVPLRAGRGPEHLADGGPQEPRRSRRGPTRSRRRPSGQHRAGCDCALYASSYDQVYAGWDKEGGADGDRWVAAVRPDRGPGRAVRRGDDPGLLHVLRRAGTRRTTRTSGAARRSPTSAASATPATTPRRTRTPFGRSRYSAGSVTQRLAGYTGTSAP